MFIIYMNMIVKYDILFILYYYYTSDNSNTWILHFIILYFWNMVLTIIDFSSKLIILPNIQLKFCKKLLALYMEFLNYITFNLLL